MTSSPDDLVPLLLSAAPGTDIGFRQGTVTAFNSYTGTSTVEVAGGSLSNLPFLSAGGLVELEAGDTVILMRLRSSWAVLGRVNSPGGTAAIGRYTEQVGLYAGSGSNFAVTSSYVTQATAPITVPVWAKYATFNAKLMILAKNTTGAADFLGGRIVSPDGNTTSWSSGTIDAGEWASMTVVRQSQQLVTGGSSVSLLGQVSASTGGWTAQANNATSLTAVIHWNSDGG